MIPLTGLWKNTTKDGKTYMSGNLGGAKVMIFANSYKTEDKHPDYQLYIAENKKKEETKSEVKSDPAYSSDSIPF